MSTYDVTVKSVAPMTVAAVRMVVPHLSEIGSYIGTMSGEVCALIGQAGVRPAGALFAIYHQTEWSETNIDLEVALPVEETPEPGAALEQGKACFRQVEGAEVACTIHRGPYEAIGNAHEALARWIEANGYELAGLYREHYLVYPEPGRDPATLVTELQYPVRKR